MMKRIIPGMAAMAVMLAGCQAETATEEGAAGEDGAETAEAGETTGLVFDDQPASGTQGVQSDGSSASFDPDCVIAADSVAGISRPATLGEFVNAFPAETVLSFEPVFMVDFGSLCTRANGADAICAIFESYEVENYDAGIAVSAIGVYSDQCRTADGVGPGTNIEDAVAAYGEATFGFSYENESREYVSFAEGPEGLSFRAESTSAEGEDADANHPVPGGRHGGDYEGVEGDSYFETTTAHPDARIWEVWIN